MYHILHRAESVRILRVKIFHILLVFGGVFLGFMYENEITSLTTTEKTLEPFKTMKELKLAGYISTENCTFDDFFNFEICPEWKWKPFDQYVKDKLAWKRDTQYRSYLLLFYRDQMKAHLDSKCEGICKNFPKMASCVHK